MAILPEAVRAGGLLSGLGPACYRFPNEWMLWYLGKNSTLLLRACNALESTRRLSALGESWLKAAILRQVVLLWTQGKPPNECLLRYILNQRVCYKTPQASSHYFHGFSKILVCKPCVDSWLQDNNRNSVIYKQTVLQRLLFINVTY